MSASTSQADRLRTAADQLVKALYGKFDAIEPLTIPPMMREAADTIEDLQNRLTEQMCELEMSTNMEYIRCSKCHYRVPKGTDLMSVKYCAGCGRRVFG